MTREEAIKVIKEHCYFASLRPEAKKALDMAIETYEDFKSLNAINLDLASENEDLIERIGKLIGFIDFLRNTAQGKKKSLNLLEKVVKGELEEIRAEGENFVKPRTDEWIPVTERLPEKDGNYLLYGRVCEDEENPYIFIGEYDGCAEKFGFWRDYYDSNTLGYLSGELIEYSEVLVWMPLPEPYREVSE